MINVDNVILALLLHTSCGFQVRLQQVLATVTLVSFQRSTQMLAACVSGTANMVSVFSSQELWNCGLNLQSCAGRSIEVLCQDGQVTSFVARRSGYGVFCFQMLPAWKIIWLQAIFRCFPVWLDSACLNHCSAWKRPQYSESIAIGSVSVWLTGPHIDHRLLQVSPAIPEIKSRILEAAISETIRDPHFLNDVVMLRSSERGQHTPVLASVSSKVNAKS